MWPFDRKKWEDIGISVTRARLHSLIESRVGPGVRILLRDSGTFRLLPRDDFADLMLRCRKIDPPYQSQIFDCDDYGDTFMGDMKRGWEQHSRGEEPLGMGWVHLWVEGSESRHWMNWMCDEYEEFLLVEPQRDQIVEREVRKYYSVAQ